MKPHGRKQKKQKGTNSYKPCATQNNIITILLAKSKNASLELNILAKCSKRTCMDSSNWPKLIQITFINFKVMKNN